MSDGRFANLFFAHTGKIVDKWEQYLAIYEAELRPFAERGEPVRLLEIGVQNGGSLELWSTYLPQGSDVVGLDIDPRVADLAFEGGVQAFVADINDAARVNAVLGEGTFDIIIDDGSHMSGDIVGGFRLLFTRLRPGGLYIVEDLHASYWSSHQGGFRQPRSSIEFFKSVVDAMGVDYVQAADAVPQHEMAELHALKLWIGRVTFYDSVAVVQKLPSEKHEPFRRVMSGLSYDVVDPVEGFTVGPWSAVEGMKLGAATAPLLNTEVLDRLLAEVRKQEGLLSQIENLRTEIADVRGKRAAETDAASQPEHLHMEVGEEREKQVAETVTETNELRRTIAELQAQRDAAVREHGDALMKQAVAFATATAAWESDKAGWDVERAAWDTERAALRGQTAAELEVAASVLAQTQARTDALLASTSWRATGPLRVAGRFAGRSKRSLSALLRSVPTKAASPGATGGSAEVPPAQSLGTDEQVIRESGLFDEAWYLSQTPALAGHNLIAHYVSSGATSGLDPNPAFHSRWYLATYQDVKDAGLNPLVHYIQHGAREFRDPSPFFSSAFYLRENEDVDQAGLNPLQHYLHHGGTEGRDPHPTFASRWYRETFMADVDPAINPLLYYIRVGRAAGHASKDPRADYWRHVVLQDQSSALEATELAEHVKAMVIRPHFMILIDGSEGEASTRTTRSLDAQLYPDWTACSSMEELLGRTPLPSGEPWFFVRLEPGDQLHFNALYALASAINAEPEADLVYADEDHLDGEGRRHTPFFKPDWSPDYLESLNYIGRAACLRGDAAAPLLADDPRSYDLVLRFTEQARSITHVRQVLLHRRDGDGPTPSRIDQDIAALRGRFKRTGRTADVRPAVPGQACYDGRLTLQRRPKVSIVIPTAGRSITIGGASVDLITHCIDTIEARSTYRDVEFVVVDNGDLNSGQIAFLRHKGAQRVTFGESTFNVAKKLNLGASVATGEMLLLLNDDIEPLAADWIERLLEHFEKPHVGVVGAKLLYGDHTTQHVGVVLNAMNPDHVRRLRPRDDLGYFFSTACARNFVAVTGACMMVRAAVYRQVGGYSEALAISYNDADFCMKVREVGHSIVYAPQAELIHYESQSREVGLSPSEAKYFHKRWSHVVTDPYYNELELTVASPTFEVRHNPRLI